MASIDLDGINQKLLNLVQVEFPLTREPFADLGGQLGIDGDEVVRRIEQLKARGIIRQISPVFDARSLGYQSTLVAMRVAEPHLEGAAGIIYQHPGVSHSYQRDHHFNLWFTLVIPPAVDIEAELGQLTAPIGAEAVFALPAIKVYKLRAYFGMGEDGQSAAGTGANTGAHPGGRLPRQVELSPRDRLVINGLQQDLSLVPHPFADLAARLGMDEAGFLARCRSLKQRGIMRRFGAAINHRRVGFQANAMACWIAPPDKVDVAGQRLAARREVSHCYERQTNLLWHYNLFAMSHGHTREGCREVAGEVSAETGLRHHVLLFSTREFKKTRVKYLV